MFFFNLICKKTYLEERNRVKKPLLLSTNGIGINLLLKFVKENKRIDEIKLHFDKLAN